MLPDIADEADVAALVEVFYRRCVADPLLGPLFDVAGTDLRAHLPVMTDFWTTVLLGSGRYRRNALAPHRSLHARVPLTDEHFARWLGLWRGTLAERHAGPVAERAVVQAERIAGALQRRLGAPAEDGLLQVARGPDLGPITAR